MSEATFATVSSVFTIGGLVGALAAGPLSSHHGRLVSMRLTAVIFLLGSILETVAISAPTLATGRVFNGIGAGASTVIVPLYISEMAPTKSRGFFGAFTQITVNVGILFTQVLGYFLSHGIAWRWILGTGILVALLHILGLLLLPESPAWIASHRGDSIRARRILQKVRGQDANLDDEVASWPVSNGTTESQPAEEQGLLDHETAEIVTAAPKRVGSGAKSQATVGFIQVLRDPLYRPAIISVIGVMVAQQACGINSVIMYSVSLLKGMLPLSSALLTVIISAVNLITTISCAPLPDRYGRKACILLSIVGQGTSALVLALSIMFGVKLLSAFSVLTFVAFFAVGLGPVPFILASELVGPEAVSATQSWALGANYVATFLVAQFFPLVNTALNNCLGGAGWVYFLFSTFATLSALFVFFYVPETNGKKDADEVW